MKTICAGCDLVLTDDRGRIHSGNYDSNFPLPKMTADTAYAWCDQCYEKLVEETEE